VGIVRLHRCLRDERIERDPQLCAGTGIAEPLRQHADDGVGHRVKQHLAADYPRVAAESTLPEAPAEDDCLIGAVNVIGWGEKPAERRLDTEQP